MSRDPKKFTIYEILNKAANAVTTVGQLFCWQVSTAEGMVQAWGHNEEENLPCQLYSAQPWHVKSDWINTNFNWRKNIYVYLYVYAYISPSLLGKRTEIVTETLNSACSASKEQRGKAHLWQQGVKKLPTAVFHKAHHKTWGMPKHMPKLRN